MCRPTIFAALLLSLLLTGCIARTAAGVVTAPVRVASQAADWATTSQDEADRERGREIRRAEERLGRLARAYGELAAECEDGDDDACRDAVRVRGEIDALRPAIPPEQ